MMITHSYTFILYVYITYIYIYIYIYLYHAKTCQFKRSMGCIVISLLKINPTTQGQQKIQGLEFSLAAPTSSKRSSASTAFDAEVDGTLCCPGIWWRFTTGADASGRIGGQTVSCWWLFATYFIFISTKISCSAPKDTVLNIESLNCCQMDQDHLTWPNVFFFW